MSRNPSFSLTDSEILLLDAICADISRTAGGVRVSRTDAIRVSIRGEAQRREIPEQPHTPQGKNSRKKSAC